jgi:hypothetical protein
MKTRMAWGLTVLLAVLLLSGAGIGIRHTFHFAAGFRSSGRAFFNFPYGGTHYNAVGPVYVAWWCRSR